ncbi:sulfite exporter TauE/SafE family protein [Taklimakanibacter deserti]|uniref:sulfite exporter TauE/SafE family protein n=1 Tax=Taklimakanibacter deserti TaxID=2267839 RepID=UPI000E646984
MGWDEIALLFAGGVLAGCINVVAGGAGFMTFPLLVAAGMSEIEANASNFVALLPANVASLFGYRYELRRPNLRLRPRLALAAIGGTCGSLALLGLGEASFRSAIPWLLTFSTVAFALAPTIKRWLEHKHGFDGRSWIWLSFLLEFIVYVYGGYFGLGMGVVLLALYAMFGHDDLHEANAIRNATITLITLIGIALFAHAGVIRWLPSLIMMLGAFIGGYVMIKFVRSVPQNWVRWGILVWSVTLTGIAFWRYS